MASRAHPAPRSKVSPSKFLALLLAFVLLCGAGGVASAGMLVPLALGTNDATDSVVGLFDELPDEIKPARPSEMSYLYYSDGTTEMAKIYAQNRIVKPLEEISPIMQAAIIAVEDKRFYEHGAVDLMGIARAGVKSMNGPTEGGSTLTQQYVKNVLIDKALREDDPIAIYKAAEGSLARKAREAKLAIALEEKMSKDDILAGYLNIAQFGRSVYGVEAASQQYFGVSAAELNYLQAATIAGITKEPSRYDPSIPANLEKAQGRRDTVLSLMLAQEEITQEEFDSGKAIPVSDTLNIQPPKVGCESADFGSTFFCDYVIKYITENEAFGMTPEEREDQLYRGGLKVVTTLDVNLQQAAQEEAVAAVPTLDPSALEDVIVSVMPGTGYIRAMAQNRPYSANGSIEGSTPINLATDQAHGGSSGFSPGSTWKAFTLAEWLNEGNTLLQSVNANKRTLTPKDFTSGPCRPQFAPWTPGNSDGSQDAGNISVLQATYNSVNTAYATMESQLDMCGLQKTAWDVGFRPSISSENDGTADSVQIKATMTLGVQNASPLQMALAYATFASGGTYCEPMPVQGVTTTEGESILVQTECDSTALPENVANTMSYALSHVLPQGQGQLVRGLDGGRPSAGKTGTANQNNHTWFVGYTPQLSTAVWIGNAEKDVPMRNMKIGDRYERYWYGSKLAAPTWARFMNRALAGQEVMQFDDPDPALVGTAPAPRQDSDDFEGTQDLDGDQQNGFRDSPQEDGTTESLDNGHEYGTWNNTPQGNGNWGDEEDDE